MIALYAVNIADLRESELSACSAMISEVRRDKAARFRFEADRIRCILGEAVVRYAMQCHWGVDQKKIHIQLDDNGRPYFHSAAPLPDFNISHAGDWVVCAIGTARTGVDVERVRRQNASLTDRVLTSREAAALYALPPEERPSAFCQRWTLKESYTKQLGLGLSMPFQTIETQQLDSGAWQVAGDSERIIFSQPWDNDYYLSLCTWVTNSDPPEITVLDARRIEAFWQAEIE